MEKIINIISEITSIKKQELNAKINEDSIWDSFNHVSIIMALEEEFNCIFEDEEIMNMKSISKILDVLNKKDLI
ncbi:acyl carrier protein [Campylobacter sp. 2018MI13]|uniref:acyl carrier protein n=1 Tax=Campylobacter sp. 2018MI13 TaxID=2836737 RepID=UPI001BDA2129|nr:acyl carrier protein [Campylobacter sp. 2018MI13]MBT0883480.1 acyl carrier protein [Campylobacter sp. 2018MI13]